MKLEFSSLTNFGFVSTIYRVFFCVFFSGSHRIGRSFSSRLHFLDRPINSSAWLGLNVQTPSTESTSIERSMCCAVGKSSNGSRASKGSSMSISTRPLGFRFVSFPFFFDHHFLSTPTPSTPYFASLFAVRWAVGRRLGRALRRRQRPTAALPSAIGLQTSQSWRSGENARRFQHGEPRLTKLRSGNPKKKRRRRRKEPRNAFQPSTLNNNRPARVQQTRCRNGGKN